MQHAKQFGFFHLGSHLGSCANGLFVGVPRRHIEVFQPSDKFVILSHLISLLHGQKMDSDALNTFLTVHRGGGISSAAKVLHRSQPAISRRIALLEEELGVPLFERVAGRTVLSDAGRVMVPYAERAVAAARDAENAVRALAQPNSGPVALAVVGTLAGGLLSTMMKRFAGEHPDVNLTLRTATSTEVSDLIRRGEATIGLRYDRDTSRDLDCELLFAEPLQVVCAPDHRLAGGRVARLADLRDERWIGFPEIPGRREIAASHVSALFLTHGLGEVEWTPVDSLTAQKRLVEAGFGIALLSESHVAEELRSSTISTIRVGDLLAKHNIVMVRRRGGFLSAASRRLLEIIRIDYRETTSTRQRAGRPKPARAPNSKRARKGQIKRSRAP
jgi:DNA-binding transcriptional LysR family regulator